MPRKDRVIIPKELISVCDFNINELSQDIHTILKREIAALMQESLGGKLYDKSARDLMAYTRLLTELEEKQVTALANMSKEELKELRKRKKNARKRKTLKQRDKEKGEVGQTGEEEEKV